jgi:hypothetical protein
VMNAAYREERQDNIGHGLAVNEHQADADY